MDSSVKGEAYGWPNFGEFSCISRSNYIYCESYILLLVNKNDHALNIEERAKALAFNVHNKD